MIVITKSRKTLAAGVAAIALVLTAGCAENEDDDPGGGKPGAGSPPQASRADRSGWPAEKVPHGAPELRAVVTEQGSGKVRVIGLADGGTVRTLDVEGQSRPVRTEDGTHVLLPQGEQGVTHLVDAGIRWEDHGGHRDPHHERPRVLGSLEGEYPSHAVPHGEHVTVFDDGTGTAQVLHVGAEHASTDPERELTAAGPHHGVAVTLETGEMVVTVPGKTEEDLPVGVRVHDKHNREVETFRDCPGLHGEHAVDDGLLLFGCLDGVLVLERGDGGWTADKIPNPAGAGAEERVSSFAGHSGNAVLGTFGDEAMAAIDLDKRTMRRVELPAPRAAYAWDPYWDQGLALTADGSLHGVDPERAEVVTSSEVTEPFEVSDDWTKNQAALAPGEESVYVTDPFTGSLIEAEVSRDGFEVTRSMELGFTPYSLTVLGMAD
ncbi:hypothetical protein [Streptomyces sp. MAR4 CNX-425]|uniref:hypothetical protein n=1 Tax=Streptomyces sp. MAR4 CNX-425 TaxID=3406343 RepID=UPI003B511B19